jgi:cobaltochelatase CobN
VPTPAAWELGKVGELLIERHARSMANGQRGDGADRLGHRQHAHRRRRYRPGAGADGRRPVWDAASRRVTGFEILPLSRAEPAPRRRHPADLGFFRDAFPDQIDLFDSAARAVAALDEPDEADNPLAARARSRNRARLIADGRRGGPRGRGSGCSAPSPAPMAPACRR